MNAIGLGVTFSKIEEPTSEENQGLLSNLQSVQSAPPLSAPPLSAPPLSAPPLSAPPLSAPKNKGQRVFNASGKPPIQAASLLVIGCAIFCGVLFLACLIIIPVLLFVVHLPFLSVGVIVSMVLMFLSFVGAYLSIHMWGNIAQMSLPDFDSQILSKV